MLFIKTFPVGALQCNCTILGDSEAKVAIVIDPGGEAPRILSALDEAELRVLHIVHTHAHIDHVGATHAVRGATGGATYLHPGDTPLHDMLALQAQFLGVPMPEPSVMDHPLQDALTLPFGAFELAVMHTPGHTPGSVCFAVPGQDVCFSGDTLFAGGIGRTDLWGGDSEAIVHSIRDRLYALNGAVQVVPGHGPVTSIDRERRANPFVRGQG